jgi:isoamylase
MSVATRPTASSRAGGRLRTEPGEAAPLGATVTPDGVAFSVYSKHATGMDLLLFDHVDDRIPGRVVTLDPTVNRTADYWHVHVAGLDPGQLYGFSARGPWAPELGQRFDPDRVLLDPYGRGVLVPDGYRRVPNRTADDEAIPMKSVVLDLSEYDWEGDEPIGRPFRETIVYEAHVKAFTAHPSSGVASDRRGTYRGFIEKIPYLVDLGVTAVELLPVFAFDRLAAPAGLVNAWGYQPVSFFAPHGAYAVRRDGSGPADEFRDLVKALHRAGLEVILDVVYNHTAEGGADGPTFGFRGLADGDYYLLDAEGDYLDYSGTGNTLRANDTIVRRLILDSLRYWVREMHVDGFRFDLAAVLSRGRDGNPTKDPSTLWDIESDPVLAGTKLIAEAWDAGGLYEVGTFVGDRWVEWNGRFRDDVRGFVKGDPGLARAAALRFLGSPDIYGPRQREPQVSLNFVTCHDGFTLEDLVSYDEKHNEANGEANRDGADDNRSWNSGVEGPTTDPTIDALRRRQIKNLLTFELLSLGAPMLLMGDEVRRSQGGNNNAYCLDDPTVWFDWTALDRHAEIRRFTTALTHLRRRMVSAFDAADGAGLTDLLRAADVTWSGVHVGAPDLDEDSHSVAITARSAAGDVHVILNAYWEPLTFEVPAAAGLTAEWRRILDTTLAPPEDIVTDLSDAAPVGETYEVGPRSVVVLVAPRMRERTRTKGAS